MTEINMLFPPYIILENGQKYDIIFRKDRYICLNHLCNAHTLAMCKDKRIADWKRSKRSEKIIDNLSIKLKMNKDQLIHVQNSFMPETWGHPLIAIEIDGWLSFDYKDQIVIWQQQQIENINNDILQNEIIKINEESSQKLKDSDKLHDQAQQKINELINKLSNQLKIYENDKHRINLDLENEKIKLEQKYETKLREKNNEINKLIRDREEALINQYKAEKSRDALAIKRNWYKFGKGKCFYIVNDPTKPGIYKVGIEDKDINNRLKSYRTMARNLKIHYLVYLEKNGLLESYILTYFEEYIEVSGSELIKYDIDKIIDIITLQLKTLKLKCNVVDYLWKYNKDIPLDSDKEIFLNEID